MRPAIIYLALLFCVLPQEGCSRPNDDQNHGPNTPQVSSIRVLWSVSGFVVLPGSTWDETQAENLLFQTLDIDNSSITFGNDVCRNVVFHQKEVLLAHYLAEIHPDAGQHLNIPEEKATLIQTNCDIPGFSEYLRLPDMTLAIHINGVFFWLTPNINL